MTDIIMSPIGFWSLFTLVFIFIVMGWFIYKMVKLSGQKTQDN